MLIRVRTNVGIWRVDGLDETTSTAQAILDGIAATRPHVDYETPFSLDPAGRQLLQESSTLASQGLRHGSMVYCKVDPSTCADNTTTAAADAGAAADTGAAAASEPTMMQNMRRIIDKDGSIKMVHDDSIKRDATERGFRKGMLPLRDIKMHWTLNEFCAMDDQYNFKIQRQDKSFVVQGGGTVSLETTAANDFQSYLRRFQFQRQQFGYLYGKFVPISDDTDKKDDEVKCNVIVEAIYEPPQEADPSAPGGFSMLEDEREEQVDKLASLMGLEKVGWIYGHPPREKGFVMSSAEVIMAAELQLEQAQGVQPSPFVTIKVTVGDDANVSFEAFQVSRQCMEMVAEEALQVGPNPGFCYVKDTFTAIQEGKPSKTVENNFFLTVVPIEQHNSDLLVQQFPKANRDHDDRTPSKDELKRQLSKSGSAGWSFIDLLSDFHLLLYLTQFLDMETDMPKICESIVNRDIPLNDGYKLIIASMAGMDGSY